MITISEYPKYKHGEKIAVTLSGQEKPIICHFIRWEEKEDRPGRKFLVVEWNGQKRFIDDWFIGNLNGLPFRPFKV